MGKIRFNESLWEMGGDSDEKCESRQVCSEKVQRPALLVINWQNKSVVLTRGNCQ